MRNRIDGTKADWEYVGKWLKVVEAELNTDCNRACKYCPQAVDGVVPKGGVMSDELFDAMLEDLARAKFFGRFSHHRWSEPLLDDKLDDRIRQIKERVPGAVQVLYSNGDLMTDDRHEELLEAGVDVSVITRHSVGPYPKRRQQVLIYAREMELTSRGGVITYLTRKRNFEPNLPCFSPSEHLILMYDGLVMRCYEQSVREDPWGDLSTHTLAAIWANNREKREKLHQGPRSAVGGICETCDNVYHAVPGNAVAGEPWWLDQADAVEIAAKRLKVGHFTPNGLRQRVGRLVRKLPVVGG